MHLTTGLHACQELQTKKLLPEFFCLSFLQPFRPCCHTQLAPAPASAWVLAPVAGVAVRGLSARPCLPQLTASELAYKIRILYNCPWQLAALPGLQNSSILYNWVSLLRRAHLRGSLREPPAWSAKGSGLRPLRKKTPVLEKGQLLSKNFLHDSIKKPGKQELSRKRNCKSGCGTPPSGRRAALLSLRPPIVTAAR